MVTTKKTKPKGGAPLLLRARILAAAAAERARRTEAELGRGTAERRHHDLIAGDEQGLIAGDEQGHVVTRVEQLYQTRRIDEIGRAACSRLYRDWALGVHRAYEPRGGAADTDAGEMRYLIALERYRRAMAGVGPGADGVLELLVCHEGTWADVAALLGSRAEALAPDAGTGVVRTIARPLVDDAEARAVACICIRDLADVYRRLDQAR